MTTFKAKISIPSFKSNDEIKEILTLSFHDALKRAFFRASESRIPRYTGELRAGLNVIAQRLGTRLGTALPYSETNKPNPGGRGPARGRANTSVTLKSNSISIEIDAPQLIWDKTNTHPNHPWKSGPLTASAVPASGWQFFSTFERLTEKYFYENIQELDIDDFFEDNPPPIRIK